MNMSNMSHINLTPVQRDKQGFLCRVLAWVSAHRALSVRLDEHTMGVVVSLTPAHFFLERMLPCAVLASEVL